MKHPEEMTREELKQLINEAVNNYFQNVIFRGITPFYNVSTDIINQLTNYSRN